MVEKTTQEEEIAQIARTAEVSANKIIVWSSTPSDVKFPSEKLITSQLALRQSYYLEDAGSANQIYITMPDIPSLPPWTDWTQLEGIQLMIKMAASNTGATTFAVDGLSGTKNVKKQVSAALVSGDLLIGGIYEFIYDRTNVQVM